MNKIRVATILPESMVGTGITTVLGKEAIFDVVYQTAEYTDLQQLYLQAVPHVLLLLILPPYTQAIDGLRVLRRHQPQAKVIIITLTFHGQCLQEVIQFSAGAFLLVSDPPQALHSALHAVAQGNSWFTTDALHHYFRLQHTTDQPSVTALLGQLTDKERTVLTLLARGWSNEQISTQLGVTARTIRFYTQQIYEKLQLSSRSEAIVWAIKAGLG